MIHTGGTPRGRVRVPAQHIQHLGRVALVAELHPAGVGLAHHLGHEQDRASGLDACSKVALGELGRFNNLSGGKPDFTPDAYDAMQQWADEMMAGGMVHNLTPPAPPPPNPCASIDPATIEVALTLLKVEQPDLWRIIEYFQTPPPLRRWTPDGLAGDLDTPTDAKGLYRRRHWALYEAWKRLPLVERMKVPHDGPTGEERA